MKYVCSEKAGARLGNANRHGVRRSGEMNRAIASVCSGYNALAQGTCLASSPNRPSR